MRNKTAAPDLAALLVVVIWGVNFPLLKFAFGGFGLWTFTFLRFAGMLLLAWLVLLARPVEGKARIERGDWPRAAISALLGFTLYISASLAGVYFTTAFSNALIMAAAPVFVLLLLWAFRVEWVGAWRAAGMATAFVGIGVFVGSFSGGSLAGNLLNLAAAFFYAAYSVVNKPLVSRYPARVLTAWTLTVGAAPVLLLAAPSLASQDWSRVTAGDWAVLAWSTVFPVYFAWTVWSWAQSRIGVARPAMLMYLVPVVAGAISWALLGESFTVLKVLGAGIVLVGVIVSRRTQPVRRQATNPGLAAN